ncbi:hypothetical protein L195_g044482, partial [Trifolium pratense]
SCTAVTIGREKILLGDDVPSNFVPKLLKTIPFDNSVQDGLKAGGYIDAGAPSSLPPKHKILTPLMYA